MKKSLLILVSVLFVAMLLGSCRSKGPVCPAYRSQQSIEQPARM